MSLAALTLRGRGEEVTLFTSTGSTRTTRGLFSISNERDTLEEGGPVIVTTRTLTLAPADAAGIEAGDKVRLRNTDYTVGAVQPNDVAVQLDLTNA